MVRAKTACMVASLVASTALAQSREPLQQIAQSVGAIAIFWFVAITYLVIAAWVSFISALLPQWVNQRVSAIEMRSILSFLIGLVVVVVLGTLAVVLGEVGKNFPPAGLLALIILFTLLTSCSVGWVPVTWIVGRRIALAMNWGRDDLPVALAGALVLHLLLFLPIVGWAVILCCMFIAIGALVVKA